MLIRDFKKNFFLKSQFIFKFMNFGYQEKFVNSQEDPKISELKLAMAGILDKNEEIIAKKFAEQA